MTSRQLKVLSMYLRGQTIKQIAQDCGVRESSIAGTLRKALGTRCPFCYNSDCATCILKECAFKDQYKKILNNEVDDLRSQSSKRMTKRLRGELLDPDVVEKFVEVIYDQT